MTKKTRHYLCALFFDGLSTGLFLMALPWLMLSGEGNGLFVASVAIVCTAASFLVTPFFATLIDRHSRKLILLSMQGLQALTAVITLLVSIYVENQLIWLAAAQLIFWVSSDVAWTASNAFVQENFQPEEYAQLAGRQEVVLQGTTLAAGALGILLLQRWSLTEFALFASIASSLGWLFFLLTPYNRQPRSLQSKASFKAELVQSASLVKAQPRFFALLMLSTLSYPLLTYLAKLVPIWFAEQGVSGSWFSAYYLSFGLGSLLVGFVIQKLLARFQQTQIMLAALFAISLLLLTVANILTPIFVVGFAALFGVFNAANRIARINWMHHQIEVSKRGRSEGVLTLFSIATQNLSYVVIALLSAQKITHYGFYIAAVVMLFAALAFYGLVKGRTALNDSLTVKT
ncbi:MFS transporter [Reinekea thalattae]|nr:MFS transporter [Reinekea thalattae]